MAVAIEPSAGHVLVVDDSPLNRDLLSRRLIRQGLSVTSAENGRSALDMLGGGGIDLVLLDVMMPEMSGFEVLAQLKAHDTLRHVPVIMISAAEDADGIARCIELGAEDYLPKPFNPVILKARVEASLEKKRLRDRERVHARSLERELEIGREIQSGFFPEPLPVVDGWEVAAQFHAARQVAGDFYDAFLIGGTGKIGIVVADVCDKGVGAALFMALFRTLIRAIADRFADSPAGREVANAFAPDPLVISDSGVTASALCLRYAVTATNDYIARVHARANMFATLFFAIIDPESGLVQYINGGHEPPLVLRDGRVDMQLEPTGPALGLMPDVTFNVRHTMLRRGDTLVAFTDGATDQRGADGSLFGDERVAALCTGGGWSAEELLGRVHAGVRAHAAGAEQSDDIAMLAVRRW
jgi:serine phosphatase RsbU (regulator of sigma subunit)